MSTDNENEKESGGLDISRYSEKTRKVIFYSVVGFLLVVTAVSIFIISPLLSSSNNDGDPAPAPTSSDIGVNPDTPAGPEPSANPTSAEDEMNQAQQDIINQDKDIQPDGKTHTDEDSAVPNSDHYVDVARNGVLAYCVISPGETTDQRKQKMAQWFNPDNTTYKNPAEFYYQRTCEIGATSEASKNSSGQIVVYVGTAWSAVLSDSNADATTGYTQYTVILDDSGILSLQ